MKRPRKNKEAKYMLKQICNADVLLYVKEIDRYCDELEKQLKDSYLIDVLNRLDKTEKALDKACKWLSMNEEAISLYNEYHDKQMWKEWCLKDE